MHREIFLYITEEIGIGEVLTLRNISKESLGVYSCIAKNSELKVDQSQFVVHFPGIVLLQYCKMQLVIIFQFV